MTSLFSLLTNFYAGWGGWGFNIHKGKEVKKKGSLNDNEGGTTEWDKRKGVSKSKRFVCLQMERDFDAGEWESYSQGMRFFPPPLKHLSLLGWLFQIYYIHLYPQTQKYLQRKLLKHSFLFPFHIHNNQFILERGHANEH